MSDEVDEPAKRDPAPEEDAAKALPRGIDPPAEPTRGAELEAARDLLVTLRAAQALPARDRAAAVADKTRHFQTVTGLTPDGVYGTQTRARLARVLDVSASTLPATIRATASSSSSTRTRTSAPSSSSSSSASSSSSSSPTPAADARPAQPNGLSVAAALARWTEDARAADSIAAQKLRGLAPHAAVIAPLTNTAMHGIVVGELPSVPTPEDAAQWAANAWDRAVAEGASARASLSSHAREITSQAERALSDVRRALDRETDSAVRGALQAVEEGLTAILRPLSRAVRNVVAPIGPGLVLIGLAALAFMGGGGRRR